MIFRTDLNCVHLSTEGIDSLDVEDFLAEILNNEFDVIVEDGSLPKVHKNDPLKFQS